MNAPVLRQPDFWENLGRIALYKTLRGVAALLITTGRVEQRLGEKLRKKSLRYRPGVKKSKPRKRKEHHEQTRSANQPARC